MENNNENENESGTVKIRLLYLGAMECRKDCMICSEDKEEVIRIPVTALLIRHPKLGNIVYDTGNSENWKEELSEDLLKYFPVVEFRSLRDALVEEGLTPDTIDLVIIFHLHYDHAGGLKIFAGTPAGQHILVGRKEWERAVESVKEGQDPGYVKEQFLNEGLHFDLLEEDRSLAEDFRVFIQTNHSPALLGLDIRRTGKPPLLCVSDAVYMRENYDRELPPDTQNEEKDREFFENLQHVKTIQRESGANILFGHDLEQVQEIIERQQV